MPPRSSQQYKKKGHDGELLGTRQLSVLHLDTFIARSKQEGRNGPVLSNAAYLAALESTVPFPSLSLLYLAFLVRCGENGPVFYKAANMSALESTVPFPSLSLLLLVAFTVRPVLSKVAFLG